MKSGRAHIRLCLFKYLYFVSSIIILLLLVTNFGTVSVDRDMVIICVVGDLRWEECRFQAKVLEALADIPLRMISYGGSNYNISVLVRRDDKIKALKALSQKLF